MVVTLKSVVFGSNWLLPPLVSEGGELVCESVLKADLLPDHFDSKLTCHPFPSLTIVSYREFIWTKKKFAPNYLT